MSILLCILLASAVLTLGYFTWTRDLLWALNFGVLQWFGLRLFCGWSMCDYPQHETPGRWWSATAPPRGVPACWSLWCWMVPLTGWWSDPRVFTSKLHVHSLRWPGSASEVR